MPRRTQVSSVSVYFKFRLRGYYPLWQGFPVLFFTFEILDPRSRIRRPENPTTPGWQRCNAYTHPGLGSSPFARRYSGNRSFFLFLQVLRCFSSLRSLLRDYGFITGWQRLSHCRVSPVGNPWVYARLTTHQGLSQPTTSFIASQRPGIHRMPFKA